MFTIKNEEIDVITDWFWVKSSIFILPTKVQPIGIGTAFQAEFTITCLAIDYWIDTISFNQFWLNWMIQVTMIDYLMLCHLSDKWRNSWDPENLFKQGAVALC